MILIIEYLAAPEHKICNVLQFIEDNSVLVGVVTSVIVGSLWLHKFLKQRRAEAFFGFYSQLMLYLGEVHKQLDENNLLNVNAVEQGNLFSLAYVEETCKTLCPAFSIQAAENRLRSMIQIVQNLEEVILKSDNNVYPKTAKPDQWLKNQQILISFCEFVKNASYWHTNNSPEASLEPFHVQKGKDLCDAIDYIEKAISATKY